MAHAACDQCPELSVSSVASHSVSVVRKQAIDAANFSSPADIRSRVLAPLLLPRGIGADCVRIIADYWGDDPYGLDAVHEKRRHRNTLTASAVVHWALYLVGFVASFFSSEASYELYLLACAAIVVVYALCLAALSLSCATARLWHRRLWYRPRRFWTFARTGLLMTAPTLLSAAIMVALDSVLAAQAYQFAVFYILGHAVFFDLTWQRRDRVKHFCFRPATNEFQSGHWEKGDKGELSSSATINLISDVSLFQYDEHNLLVRFSLPFYYHEACVARLTPELWQQLNALDWSTSPIADQLKNLLQSEPKVWRGTVPLGVMTVSKEETV